ncbi:MAG: SRPBCC family protein [Bacteroidia bacterium]|jgi:uncharacterized protein YndB with AHSA1/START domain
MYEKITINAAIAADRKKVWDAYTNSTHIVNWNFASDDWCCPTASNDLRVGGKYTARMEAKDGSFGFDFESIYDEVIPEEKLVFTLGDGRKVDIAFTGSGNETAVTIVFDAENENPLEMQRGGWQAILNNFKKYTEQL